MGTIAESLYSFGKNCFFGGGFLALNDVFIVFHGFQNMVL